MSPYESTCDDYARRVRVRIRVLDAGYGEETRPSAKERKLVPTTVVHIPVKFSFGSVKLTLMFFESNGYVQCKKQNIILNNGFHR